MRIAIICSPAFPLPPHQGYGGIQRGVYELAIGCAELGDTVHVFCSDSSNIKHSNVIRHSCGPVAAYEETMTNETEHNDSQTRHTASVEMIKKHLTKLVADEAIDLINLRWDSPDMQSFCQQFGLPLVVSIHTNLDQDLQAQFFKDDVVYTALTATHKQALGSRNNILNNQYGISMNEVISSTEILTELLTADNLLPVQQELHRQGRNYLVHISNIYRWKSTKSAIEIAKRVGLPLVIAGISSVNKDRFDDTMGYFLNEVQPHFDDQQIIYYGSINEHDKYILLRHATAFIFTAGMEDSSWSEPFGRVIAESLAAGTPVIGYQGGGSVVDQVRDGMNGYLFNTVDEAVAATESVGLLDRALVAQDARERLSSDNFIATSRAIFEKVISKSNR